MEIPSREIWGASEPPLEDLRSLDRSATSVSAYGRAKGLGRLAECPQLERLWLSGVSGRHAGDLPHLPTLSELVFHDYRIESLEALPDLPRLESLAVCGSPKLRFLTGVQRYERLTRLILFDCSNYADLSPLRALTGLETLCLEGGFSKVLRVRSLQPLSGLRRLRLLRLASIRVAEDGLAPLEGLNNLDSVFIARTFSDTDLRRLAHALPRASGEFLDTFRGEGAD